MIDPEPPLGPKAFGLVTCLACSRQLAWLRAPLSTTQRRAMPEPPDDDARSIALQDFTRHDGCSDACSPQRGHDYVAHEQYGRRKSPLPPLVVDGDVRVAYLGAYPLALSGREYEILHALAGSLGKTCRRAELIRVVFETAIRGRAEEHMLRMYTARLKTRLLEAGSLVETVPFQGLRLRVEPPCDYDGPPPSPRSPSGRERIDGWSLRWPSCRVCSTVVRPHKGHGLCARCLGRVRRGLVRCSLEGDDDAHS